MSITTPLQPEDNGANSRVKLNDNFNALEVAIEEVINDGAPLASTTVAGRSKLSVAPVSASDPIAVGDNDPRLPDSDLQNALSGGGDFGTPSSTNKFLTENFKTANPAVDRTVYDISGSPHTWTKKAGLKFILVEAWGGGGSGSASHNTGSTRVGAGGGGGGGYVCQFFNASDLGPTVTVTIGAGGAAVSRSTTGDTNGNNGANTTFGSLLTAFGGGAGTFSGNTGNGGSSFAQGGGTIDAGAGGTISTSPTDGGFGTTGGGGGGGYNSQNPPINPRNGGVSIHGGGGGGGAVSSIGTGAGGASKTAGAGGAGGQAVGANATATSGSVPAGGGGGVAIHSGTGFTATSGAGGAGRVIVTEFYS